MATLMYEHMSLGYKPPSGVRVVLCDPDHELRASLRSVIEADSVLVLVGEARSWADCANDLENLSPELLIVRSGLLPRGWAGSIDQDAFSPVVITLCDADLQPVSSACPYNLFLPASPAAVRASLDRAVAEIYDRKLKQLLDLVTRYVAGSASVRPYQSVISVDSEGRNIEVRTESIISITAARKCVSIQSLSGRFTLRKPIHQVATELDPSAFIRIHRSIIVNRRHVHRQILLGRKLSEVILVDGSRYPVGANYRETTADQLKSKSQ